MLAPVSRGVTIDGRQKISPEGLDTALFNFFESGMDEYDTTNAFLHTRTGIIRMTADAHAPVDQLVLEGAKSFRTGLDQHGQGVSTKVVCDKVLAFITSQDPDIVARRNRAPRLQGAAAPAP